MSRYAVHASLALLALVLAACASPGPSAEAGRSGAEASGNTIDNSTPGSGALIGHIWF